MQNCLNYLGMEELDAYVAAKHVATAAAHLQQMSPITQANTSDSLRDAPLCPAQEDNGQETNDGRTARRKRKFEGSNDTNPGYDKPFPETRSKQRPQSYLRETGLASKHLFPRAGYDIDSHMVEAVLPNSETVLGDAVSSWLDNLPIELMELPREAGLPTGNRSSTAPQPETEKSSILDANMPLLPYITAYFWGYAKAADQHSSANVSTELRLKIINRFAEPCIWQRWQAIDERAPFAPDTHQKTLQCSYLDTFGLASWAQILRAQDWRMASEPERAEGTDRPRLVRRGSSVHSFSSASSHHSKDDGGYKFSS